MQGLGSRLGLRLGLAHERTGPPLEQYPGAALVPVLDEEQHLQGQWQASGCFRDLW